MTPLRVLAVASEIYPIVKTGGLADVVGALPAALRTYDIETRTLAPAYFHYAHRPRPATVMTIHNLAYPGQFPYHMLDAFGLPPESFSIHGVEYYGTISFLKAGLQFSDRITTVSPTYAHEIEGDEG